MRSVAAALWWFAESNWYFHNSGSKLSVSSVRGSIKELLSEANGENKRNFVETIELQIGLKNYDPQRDKRFSGTVKWIYQLVLLPWLFSDGLGYRLPNVPRPRMSICILADAADIDRAKQIDLEYMSADDLKKLVLSLTVCLKVLNLLTMQT
jgi:large subunit ribosomal protein L10Ae